MGKVVEQGENGLLTTHEAQTVFEFDFGEGMKIVKITKNILSFDRQTPELD